MDINMLETKIRTDIKTATRKICSTTKKIQPNKKGNDKRKP